MAKENHILVGLGGTGGKVLKAFRKRLYQEFNAEQRAQLPIGFLYVDSSIEMMKPDDKTWQVLGENAQFSENEFVNVKGIDINAVLANPSNYPGLKGIIGDAEVMRKTLGEVGAAAAQKRRAGRILFGSNIDKYKTERRVQPLLSMQWFQSWLLREPAMPADIMPMAMQPSKSSTHCSLAISSPMMSADSTSVWIWIW